MSPLDAVLPMIAGAALAIAAAICVHPFLAFAAGGR